MYYQSYEEYMRDVLGYPGTRDTVTTYPGYQNIYESVPRVSTANREIEKMYPDIYGVVYPMVCSACDKHIRTSYRR